MAKKVEGFMEAKRRVVRAIDFRLKNLRSVVKVTKTGYFASECRIDELETLRSFVKGMVVKVK